MSNVKFTRCRPAKCTETVPNIDLQTKWRRTIMRVVGLLKICVNATVMTPKFGHKATRTPVGFTQWLYCPNIIHYYSLGAGSQRAEKRRCSRFSRREAASLPRPAAAHPFGKEKKIHTDRRQRRREKVARAGGGKKESRAASGSEKSQMWRVGLRGRKGAQRTSRSDSLLK